VRFFTPLRFVQNDTYYRIIFLMFISRELSLLGFLIILNFGFPLFQNYMAALTTANFEFITLPKPKFRTFSIE
jgi:hypothetical protein